MSGVEVAGLVLAVLAVLVEAIKFYAEGVSTVERYLKYRVPLQSVLRALENKKVIYLNTCEILLNGLVDSNEEREALLKDPGGPAWKNSELETRLKRRLSGGYGCYLDTMGDMQKTIENIKEPVKLDPDGKVQFNATTKFRKEYYRLKFSLKKQDYDGLVGQIRQHNRTLQTMTKQALALEPHRIHAASQLPDLVIIQKYAASVYDLLCLGFGYQHMAQSEDKNAVKRKSVRFQTSIQTQPPNSDPATASMSITAGPAHITDLCENICENTCQNNPVRIDRCMGFFEDNCNQRKLGLYRPESLAFLSEAKKPTLLSLRSILISGTIGNRRFSRLHRLRLAVLLSSGILQLHHTPWLEEAWNNEDISFLKVESADHEVLKEPFVTRQSIREATTAAAGSNGNASQWQGILNRSVFALGILLLELSLGKPFAELRKRLATQSASSSDAPNDSSDPTEPSDFTIAGQLLDEVRDESGPGYSDAVRRCVRCTFDTLRVDPRDALFRQAVYDGVVAPLEKELRHFEGLGA
ncbi:hypothetical protein GTA08_BOTSDO03899 [Botryosphaeria dothidea]|uniref:DUF7580 domain-containing protein n=1 Tax=Botryosphaeria dothidea TaxID=55169 RepID=A0A8H4N1X3_9PEZI|nr:hypothetical protein GTA08_BOTSDO03899 [Botryosphaeria dothidea]